MWPSLEDQETGNKVHNGVVRLIWTVLVDSKPEA